MSRAWENLESPLFGPVYNEVWNSFEAKFSFRPSSKQSDWPGIVEPTPSITYSISSLYTGDENCLRACVSDIHQKAVTAFRRCTEVQEPLFVLDWQHPSYLFFPHASFDVNNLSEWRIPVVPDGDYYIFINQELSLGTFGHPWEQTICVFGEKLITEFEQNRPHTFEELRRK